MQFYKKAYKKQVKFFSSFFIILFSINNLMAKGSERLNYIFERRQKDIMIEEIYKNILIPHDEYDKFQNQLRTFFGMYSVSSDKSYYPDLMLINDSRSIRKIYKYKLKNMTINKNNYIIKNKPIL